MQRIFPLVVLLSLLSACSTFQKSEEIQLATPTVLAVASSTFTKEVANTLVPTSTQVAITASPTVAFTATTTYVPYPNATPLVQLLLTTDDIFAPEVQDWDFIRGIRGAFFDEEPVYIKDKSYDLRAGCLIECTKQIWGTSRRYLEINMIRAQGEQEASLKAEELFRSLNPYHYEWGIDEYKWINAPTQNSQIGFSDWNRGYVLTTSVGTITLMIVSYPSPYSDDGLHEVSLMAVFANLQLDKLKKANLIP